MAKAPPAQLNKISQELESKLEAKRSIINIFNIKYQISKYLALPQRSYVTRLVLELVPAFSTEYRRVSLTHYVSMRIPLEKT